MDWCNCYCCFCTDLKIVVVNIVTADDIFVVVELIADIEYFYYYYLLYILIKQLLSEH